MEPKKFPICRNRRKFSYFHFGSKTTLIFSPPFGRHFPFQNTVTLDLHLLAPQGRKIQYFAFSAYLMNFRRLWRLIFPIHWGLRPISPLLEHFDKFPIFAEHFLFFLRHSDTQKKLYPPRSSPRKMRTSLPPNDRLP